MNLFRNQARCTRLFFIAILCAAATGCSLASANGTSSSPATSLPSSSLSSPTASASIPASIEPEAPKPTVPSQVIKTEFYSKHLEKNMRIQIYLPPGYDESADYPVLYMLHGYNGTEKAWLSEMGLNKAADRLIADGLIEPLIIVSPEMDNSYGLNSETKYRIATPEDPVHSRYYGPYEDYLVEDVIAYADETYRTIASKEGRSIGGFSMGGFIALHVAFRHPELFSKAGGHSPALWTDDWSRVPRMKSWLYPTKAERKKRDPIELALTQDLNGLEVYLDCGEQDDFKLYDGTKKLYDNLQSRGVRSEYHLNPGKHDRTYWRSQLDEYLLFYGTKA
ncbi:alpha/beta hydrolase [Cohnella faecalis]|uniref:Esterase n=1 Tax=Cohnella faecalis TaxID=2315694 RepID=A0A398CDL9_9BACL|nr:alpha/beta hydrolase-fold protein [Cohnella faecalis]RIE00803.1 esterase [Cohnella faecalis]